jgi:hypothetical protein
MQILDRAAPILMVRGKSLFQAEAGIHGIRRAFKDFPWLRPR